MLSPSVHVVIPARYGSSRLPGKPLVDLAGLPMVVRVYQRAKFAFGDVDIVVAIDDERISAVLDQFSIPWIMTKNNHESGTDRIAEVGELSGWSDGDTVINIQGDEPLVPSDMLVAFLDFCCHENLQMATIGVPVKDSEELVNPNVVKVVVDRNGRAMYFSRSAIPFCRDERSHQDWPVEEFTKHVGVYAYKYSVLRDISKAPVAPAEEHEKLEQLRALWMGYGISVMNWKEAPPHGVDTEEDVRRVVKIYEDEV